MNVYIQENVHIGAESAQSSSDDHHVFVDTSVSITYNEEAKSHKEGVFYVLKCLSSLRAYEFYAQNSECVCVRVRLLCVRVCVCLLER